MTGFDGFMKGCITCFCMRAILLVALLLPVASAETIVELESWVDPAELFIPTSTLPKDVPGATLHVSGEIQCQPLTEAPVDLYLNYVGVTINGTIGEEQVTYLDTDMRDIRITWTAAGNNRFVIDEQIPLKFFREAIPPQDVRGSYSWDSVQAENSGTSNCDPQGYGWTVDATPINVTAEGFGHIEDDGFEFPEQEAPAPFSLVLLALVGLAFKKKE